MSNYDDNAGSPPVGRPRLDAKRAPRPEWPVRGGDLIRCPNGHASAYLATERDAAGPRLRVWCTAPGCGAKEIVRREVT